MCKRHKNLFANEHFNLTTEQTGAYSLLAKPHSFNEPLDVEEIIS